MTTALGVTVRSRARRVSAIAVLVLGGLLPCGFVSAATPPHRMTGPTTAPLAGAPALYRSERASPTVTSRCTVNEGLVSNCGDWWGEAVPNSGSDLIQAVDWTELRTQRSLDIVHTYHRWLQAFPTPEETALARSGHILFINWQPTDPDGGRIPWASVADGSQDAVIRAEAQRLAALGVPVMVSFSHEPEANLGSEGTAADFAAAYRRVHDVAVAAGARNVVWVWDVEGIATRHWLSIYRQLWPGAADVDWIAWDPYNFAACKGRPWRSFPRLVSPFYDMLAAPPFRNRPLMLAELGTVGNLSGSHTKQSWYAGVRSSLGRYPAIKAVVYFDYPSPPATCDWTSSSSPAAAAAFALLANDRLFLTSSAAPARLGVVPANNPEPGAAGGHRPSPPQMLVARGGST